MRKVFDNNEELKELEQKLKMAQVNKLRKAQLNEKQEIETNNMVNDFRQDQKYLEKLQQENERNELINHQKKIKMLENERDVRNQILRAEAEAEITAEMQKMKDKEQVDAIVAGILHQEYTSKEKAEESKKTQFNNMVESLYLKKKLLRDQLDQEQKAYQYAVDFQKILDQRSLERASKAAAETEFKEKVYAQIEAYIKQKKALDEARDRHFQELGDAKY